MENEVPETHLKHMLERIGGLLPSAYKVLMPFSHEEIEVLILFPWYDAIVVDTFLVASHRAPSVSVESFQQRQTCAINPTVRIERHVGERDDLNLKSGA